MQPNLQVRIKWAHPKAAQGPGQVLKYTPKPQNLQPRSRINLTKCAHRVIRQEAGLIEGWESAMEMPAFGLNPYKLTVRGPEIR
eukprot:scaffold164287_cov16-Tisochrysis_lutea.AAC.2